MQFWVISCPVFDWSWVDNRCVHFTVSVVDAI